MQRIWYGNVREEFDSLLADRPIASPLLERSPAPWIDGIPSYNALNARAFLWRLPPFPFSERRPRGSAIVRMLRFRAPLPQRLSCCVMGRGFLVFAWRVPRFP